MQALNQALNLRIWSTLIPFRRFRLNGTCLGLRPEPVSRGCKTYNADTHRSAEAFLGQRWWPRYCLYHQGHQAHQDKLGGSWRSARCVTLMGDFDRASGAVAVDRSQINERPCNRFVAPKAQSIHTASA